VGPDILSVIVQVNLEDLALQEALALLSHKPAVAGRRSGVPLTSSAGNGYRKSEA
jgi:hypothetical protein